MDIAIRLAYGGNWRSLSSRLRFLDDCAVGDSWATDGMTLCFLEEIRKVAIDPGPLEPSKDRVGRKYFYSGYERV